MSCEPHLKALRQVISHAPRVLHPNPAPRPGVKILRHSLAEQERGIEESHEPAQPRLAERAATRPSPRSCSAQTHCTGRSCRRTGRHSRRTCWGQPRCAGEPGQTAPNPSTSPWGRTFAPGFRRLRTASWACGSATGAGIVASFASAAGWASCASRLSGRYETEQGPAAGVSYTLRNDELSVRLRRADECAAARRMRQAGRTARSGAPRRFTGRDSSPREIILPDASMGSLFAFVSQQPLRARD